MPDHNHIYGNEAQKYHKMISKQPDLMEVIEEIRPFVGLNVVDLGAGSGRLATGLAAQAKSVAALDASEAMLRIAADRLALAGHTNWITKVADHRNLPLEDHSADLIVSGWSICYLGDATVDGWEQNIDKVIGEIKRVLRKNGTVIIFETLGTGFDQPSPPDFLKPYYSLLVDRYGFSHKWIRTDYKFDSLQQAEELARFFFGDALADRVVRDNLVHLPECAGVWWLQVHD